jgi:hypothetical protein
VPLLFGALAILAAVLLSPGLAVGPSLDAAVFAGIAHQMVGGDLLYVDAWDHKPPGAYLVLGAGLVALQSLSPWLVSWLITVLATAGTGLGVASALAALGVRRGAAYLAAGVAVAFMAQYLTALGGGLTEPLAALPAVWALVLVLWKSLTPRRLVLIGLLLGLAALTSFQLLPAAVCVTGLGLASPMGRDRWRALRNIAIGAAVPLLVVGLALLAAGNLPAAVDAVFGYGAAYRASSAAYGGELARAPAAWTLLSALVLVAPATLGGLELWRAGHRQRQVLYSMMGWIGLAIAIFVYQGRFIAHYAIPLAIPAGVLAGIGLDVAAARWERAASAARIALAVTLGLTVTASALAGFAGGRYELSSNDARGDQVATVARNVMELTEPDDEILVWGNRPELYLAADRGSAIPYRFLYPLTTPGYVTADLVEEVRSELRENPPLLVVDAGSVEPGAPGFLPLLIGRPVAPEGREVDMLQPLRDFIGANYELVAETAGWPVYRLRSASSTGDD